MRWLSSSPIRDTIQLRAITPKSVKVSLLIGGVDDIGDVLLRIFERK